jgi:uncharacterized membrane protein YqaE (UPF0057 family)
MGNFKLFLAAVILSVALFSCSSSNEFAKVKYLDKTYAKRHKAPETVKMKQTEAEVLTPVNTVEEETTEASNNDLQVSEQVLNEKTSDVVKAPKIIKSNSVINKTATAQEIEVMASPEQVFANLELKKPAKKNKPNGLAGLAVVGTVLLVILAFLLPPLAVALKAGIGGRFLISLILTLLFWVPGVIYALLVVLDVI